MLDGSYDEFRIYGYALGEAEVLGSFLAGSSELGWQDGGEPVFSRGDTNADGALNIADAIFVLAFLFGGGPEPVCQDSADGNDDGQVNIADAVAILSHLFAGTGDLPPPFGSCGPDPTDDAVPGECAYPADKCP